jgi:hypothetical protein
MAMMHPVALPGHFGSDGDGPRPPGAPWPPTWIALALVTVVLGSVMLGFHGVPLLAGILATTVAVLALQRPEAFAGDWVGPVPRPRVRLVTPPRDVAPGPATPPPVLRVVGRH